MAVPRSRFGKFFGGAASTAGGYAAGAATADTLRPILQELVNAANAAHPVRPVTPEQAAGATFTGALSQAAGRGEAAKSGYGTDAFNVLRSLVGNVPSLRQMLDLWQRDAISVAELEQGLKLTLMRPEWIERVKSFRFDPLTPEQAAAAVERGELAYDDAEQIASLSGADAETFRVIERLAGLAPSTEQLISLRRRGAIDEARMHKGFVQGNVRSEWADALAKLSEVLLSPGELARIVAEGIMPEAEAAQLAAVVGVSGENFARLVRLAGSAPSTERLLDLWNRGEITEADVDRGLRQLGVKPEWTSALKALRHHLPTVADVIRFAVKDVFDPAVVARFGLDAEFPEGVVPLAAQRGIDEQQMRYQWRSHWRNVSPTQLYKMLHRGEITQADLELGLKTADYSPFWRDKLAAIARLVPGRIDLRRMLAAGLKTPAEAEAGYMRLGYSQADAADLVKLAQAAPSSNVRELTAAQLTSEFEAGFLTEQEYTAELDELGFLPVDAARYRKLADSRRVARAREQTLSTIRSAFVGHRLQEAEARAALDATGLTVEARDRIWAQWLEQRAANVRVLTPTQIRKLYSNADLTAEEAILELESRGFSRTSAERMLRL